MKHKVSELEGALLDAAVSKAENVVLRKFKEGVGWILYPLSARRYSIDWSAAGPIIERERIAVVPMKGQYCAYYNNGGAYYADGGYIDVSDWQADGRGPTPLIAAMRAFVRSKFGDEVELP